MPAGGVMNVVVAVLTFRREEQLRTLLSALEHQIADVSGDVVSTVNVIVVDNEPGGSARTVAEEATVAPTYVIEPVPGIAAARNRAVSEAVAAGAEILVFIDDDEEPGDGWLRALLRTFRESQPAAGVVGRVVSRVCGPNAEWLEAGDFFRRAHRDRFATGDEVGSAATNNLLLDLNVVTSLGLRFDTSLGLAGGEDTQFTLQLTRAGHRLIWCADAVVVEVVPAERSTRSVAMRRVYAMSSSSISSTIATIDQRGVRIVMRWRYTLSGLARVFCAPARVALGTATRSERLQARGAKSLARGAGQVVGAWGRPYAEYQRRH